jgi:hypothetical protein
MPKSLLAIDPSSKPVIAARLPDGEIRFQTCKKGPVEMAGLLRDWFPKPPDLGGIEKPSYYQTGDAIQNSLRFAEVCGAVQGILICLQWPVIRVSPVRWMEFIDPTNQRPTGAALYRTRKKFFDSLAEKRYKGKLQKPVRFSEGDVLCLLAYLETL